MNLELFRQRYPRFECQDDSDIESILALATMFCPAEKWGAKQIEGIGYLAAHMVETEIHQKLQTAAMGAQAAEGKGVSMPQPIQDSLHLTSYGRMFYFILQSIPVAPMVF